MRKGIGSSPFDFLPTTACGATAWGDIGGEIGSTLLMISLLIVTPNFLNISIHLLCSTGPLVTSSVLFPVNVVRWNELGTSPRSPARSAVATLSTAQSAMLRHTVVPASRSAGFEGFVLQYTRRPSGYRMK